MAFQKTNFIPNQTEPTAKFMNELQDTIIKIEKTLDKEYQGYYKIPAIIFDMMDYNTEKFYLTKAISDGWINPTHINYGDILYYTNFFEVHQVKIEKMYTSSGEIIDFNIHSHYDIDSIDLSNSQFWGEGDGYGYISECCFWFSNSNIMNGFNTFAIMGKSQIILDSPQGDNTPISENVFLSGTNNVVGCRGYQILSSERIDSNTGKYVLDSISTIDGEWNEIGDVHDVVALFPGDVYSVMSGPTYVDIGEILSVNESTNEIIVSNYVPLQEDREQNILFISSKPYLGTVDIGQNARADGYGNYALLNGAHADGKLTKAIAPYSRTGGLRTIAKGHGSVADGQYLIATRNYQRVAGQWNEIDEDKKYLDIVGCGSSKERKNAYTLDEEGNGSFLGNITGKDVLINSNIDSISILGDTQMVDGDAFSAYPYDLALNGKSIYQFATVFDDFELNSVSNISRDELVINDKMKVIRKVKKIVLGDNLGKGKNNSYYFKQNTETLEDGTKALMKRFQITLEDTKDKYDNYLLTTDEINKINSGEAVFDTYVAFCTHFTQSRISDGETYFNLQLRNNSFVLSFRDKNAVDIRKTVDSNTYYSKEEIANKITSGELVGYDIRTLPIVIYLTLLEPYEEEIEGDFTEEWNNFKNNYNNSSIIEAGCDYFAVNSGKLGESTSTKTQINYMPIMKYVDNKVSKEVNELYAYIDEQLKDFDTALDNAIALCDTYIEGGA